MTNIITFPPPKEDKPDDNCVCIIPTDGKPVKWFKFTCSFASDDGEYDFTLWARDAADAEKRLADLRATAKLDGQLFMEIPV
ncbi:hypothetical protein [uncultured Hyphomicrobium sp.]|uniref:hypothetical protein n=1 Tax=uncultured Hyphomicrobium sp. TaxID=194373 RepID=UPI0025E36ED0|nr:hypothetical protein [uncultured Hyphomicrobium sp.]